MILGGLLWAPWEVHSRSLTKHFPQHCPRPKKTSYCGPSFLPCGLWAYPGIPEAQPPLSHLLSWPEAATRTPSPTAATAVAPCGNCSCHRPSVHRCLTDIVANLHRCSARQGQRVYLQDGQFPEASPPGQSPLGWAPAALPCQGHHRPRYHYPLLWLWALHRVHGIM